MKLRRLLWLLFGVVAPLIWGVGCHTAPEPAGEAAAAEKTAVVMTAAPDNFYRVSAEIWRSGQPDREEFRSLSEAGLKSVLNLRNHHRDGELVAGLPLELYELRLNAGDLTRNELLSALRIVRKAEKPLLIHCWHGSDRTGAVVAGYRILFEGWSVEQAVDELLDPRFGHHRFYYRNIPRVLRSIDWEEMRRQVNE